jgi:hypothetical protein
MFRAPFVWEVQIRREVLDEEMTQLRELPYSIWREIIGRPMVKSSRGRDGRTYGVRTTASFTAPGSDDIRVVVALEIPGFRRRLMRQSFVITPENRFTE